MVPFYIYYSMFGFQRIGDLAWAAGDQRARGFLLGGTAGRTTLNGEGLQHEDGHSHVLFSVIPNCVCYDPTFGYELAVIIHDGLRAWSSEQEDVYYYITVMNENYAHPALPEGAEEGILKGMYLLREVEVEGQEPRVQLLGSGTILREVHRGGRAARAGLGRGGGCLELPQLHRAAPRRPRGGALEPAASRGRAARAVRRRNAWTSAPARSWPRATTSRPSPTRSAPSFRAAAPTGCSAPTASAARDSRAKLRDFFEVNRHSSRSRR